MFDWLRRWRQAESSEEATTARLREAGRPADAAPTAVLFPPDLYPSDGGAAHASGGIPCEAGHGFGCDGGGSHH